MSRKMRPSEEAEQAREKAKRVDPQQTGGQPEAVAQTAKQKQAGEDDDSYQSDYEKAKELGYTGDSCPECGSMTMVRNGTCQKCITCGSTTGCS
jgi:ribonucleoside-diphosphate reductase alpha chain